MKLSTNMPKAVYLPGSSDKYQMRYVKNIVMRKMGSDSICRP